jgi:glycosyltransferase involved in cell wall biosynthesis
MKIAADLRIIEHGVTGGLSQLIEGVLRSLLERDRDNEYLVFCTPANYSLLDPGFPNLQRVSLAFPNYDQELDDQLRYRGDIDVLFRAYPGTELGGVPLERQVVCIPDLQQEAFPDFFNRDRLRLRRQAFHHFQSGAGAIGTISEFTRGQLLADPWTRCDDIFLMPPSLPLGHDTDAPLTDAETGLMPVGPFFLFPANPWKHKNHARLLAAFDQFCRRRGPGVPLVLTGNREGFDEIAAPYRHLPVRHLGYVRPEFLRALYKRALALVYVTLFEGFGIPLLEAYSAGTPVVCSDTTSLPEVAEGAAVMCPPTDVDAIAAALERIADDDPLRRRLVELGKMRLRDFTWQRSADELLDAFERVAHRANMGVPAIRVDSPPVVSIVTPSFQQGKFLKRTIDSVLAQDYPHIDYRVIDGGSTDETLAVLASYGDRVRWCSEKDRGQAHAINKGLAETTGRIRAYLNSDDLLRPGAVSAAVEHFRRHPSCDLVYGEAAFIDEADELLRFYPTKPYSLENLMETCCISQPSAFWMSRIGDLVGAFDESYGFAMDYDYWLRIAKAGGRIMDAPGIWSATRLHATAKTCGGSRDRIFAEIWRTCAEHGGYVSYTAIDSWLRACLFPRYPALIRLRPLLARVLFVHSKYLGRTSPKPPMPAYMVGKALEYAYRVGRRFPGMNLVRKLLPRKPSVGGNRADNWLVPECRFYPKRRGPAEAIRLIGEAATPMRLVVRQGRETIAEFDLAGKEVTELTLPVRDSSEPVLLTFSDEVAGLIDRHPVSFRVLGTNLYREEEA